MSRPPQDLPRTLAALRSSKYPESKLAARSVKDELRQNLICKIQRGEELFPGILGYEDSVVPQVVNALLSRHHFILLGLRGQAKTRLIRQLTGLLDEWTPYIAGCEIHDHPYTPICRRCRDLVAEKGDETPIAWLDRHHRYVEKLATPDVTIADMIGDIDPIKAARRGQDISDELTVHYGLLPRANRGIFAINELPDLAGKIQVGLFNIMQEGDVQIKGYPVRLPLDVMLVFTANPEDYTARGKIITPLKDRIGSEIRTHYPAALEEGIAITGQEAWTARLSPVDVRVPHYIRQVVEQLAFLAREDKRVDKRSGVSQRLPISVLENVVSNAERRALRAKDDVAVPRITDIYAALPSITGKLELEYEGELKGGDTVARELIRTAVAKIYNEYFEGVNVGQIVQWFDLGGSLKLADTVNAASMVEQLSGIQGLMEKTKALGLS
ncbi:MAG: sigma 54-interacting transcriptional regulator, partial [Acidobacteriota bacterium]|nr:sigma 54-interacting transcriptional regulator [Acidobacteriota bacterium]